MYLSINKTKIYQNCYKQVMYLLINKTKTKTKTKT